MSEEKPKKKRKRKAAAEGDGTQEKEHKKELAGGVCVGRGHQGVPRREAVPQA